MGRKKDSLAPKTRLRVFQVIDCVIAFLMLEETFNHKQKKLSIFVQYFSLHTGLWPSARTILPTHSSTPSASYGLLVMDSRELIPI